MTICEHPGCNQRTDLACDECGKWICRNHTETILNYDGGWCFSCARGGQEYDPTLDPSADEVRIIVGADGELVVGCFEDWNGEPCEADPTLDNLPVQCDGCGRLVSPDHACEHLTGWTCVQCLGTYPQS
jgi:hypothetical protein